MKKSKIAIFASGGGSNALRIIEKQAVYNNYEVKWILSNKLNARVLEIADQNNIEKKVLNRSDFYSSEILLKELKEKKIEFIILAGFLWLVPPYLIKMYPNKILNIHPSLLPKYGGKGMYGKHVHQAVFDHQEKESGMTIHLVNEEFDKGEILFQEKVIIENCASADEIATKVLEQEHIHYARVISEYLLHSIE